MPYDLMSTTALPNDWGDPVATRPEDLTDREAISYLRFSTPEQGEEGKSSNDRQEQDLARVLKRYGLKLVKAFSDKGVSASKGRHRTKGDLRLLMQMLLDGRIKPGTVLIIESVSRLCREPMNISWDLIEWLTAHGLVIIFCRYSDQIWDRVSINTMKNITLVIEINIANEQAKERRDYTRGSHAKKRDALAKLQRDPKAPKPWMNRFPDWIDRKGERDSPASIRYPCNRHAKTVAQIFKLALTGMPTRQIAIWLNDRIDQYPTMSRYKKLKQWTESYVGKLLTDKRVIGIVNPKIYQYVEPPKIGDNLDDAYKVKLKKSRIHARLYEPAVDDDTFEKVRLIMIGRRKNLPGTRSKAFANLFTRKTVCPSCEGPWRTGATRGLKGPDPNGGSKYWHLICTAFSEHGGCPNGHTYAVPYYEPRILDAIATILVEPGISDDEARLSAELGQLRTRIENMEQQAADYAEAQKVAYSKTRSIDMDALNVEIDKLSVVAASVERKLHMVAHPRNHRETVAGMIRKLKKPALEYDLGAREQLRNMLAGIDFKLTGSPNGGILLMMDGQQVQIGPRTKAELNAHMVKARKSRWDKHRAAKQAA